MENTANRIMLIGELTALPELSHTNHGRRFYRLYLRVPRLSGTADVLPVMAAEDLLMQTELFEGGYFAVSGQIRSFNSREGGKRRLILCVYASAITTTQDEPMNEALLSGVICKPPVYRRTPLGREICDVMLAVNRLYHRADYIPCILWGRSAQRISTLDVGAKLQLSGRLQSREYTKVLPEGSEQRTAYELSVTAAEIISEDSP